MGRRGRRFGRQRDNVPAARALRRALTRSEALLWAELRDRRFRGLKFRRQHPVGPFVLDFFCASLSLAIEVDGGVHDDPATARADRQRERALSAHGIRVIRLPAAQVERDARATLEAAIDGER